MSDHLMQQYPAWREAVKQFIAEPRQSGDLLTFDWLYRAFSITRPQPDTPLAEAQKAELRFLSQFKSFEDVLLTEHQVALSNVRGEGYRIIPAAEQTEWAENEGVGEIKRAMRKLTNRLTNVDLVQLTPDQRKHNADALARIAMLGGMIKKAVESSSVLKLGEAATK